MEDLEFAQKRTVTNPSSIVYERKFDIALRSTHSIVALDKIKNHEPKTINEKLITSHISYYNIDVNNLVINENVYPILLNKVLNHNASLHKFGFDRLVNIIRSSVEVQSKALYSNVQSNIRPKLDTYVQDVASHIKQSPVIANLTYAFNVWTTIIDTLPAKDDTKVPKDASVADFEDLAKSCRYEWRKLDVTVAWSRQSLLLRIDTTWYLLPRPYALLIHNKISDLISVLIMAASSPDSIYGTPALQTTITFVKELMNLALQYKQKFFSISKVLEALVIGETLRRVEGRGNTVFLNTVAAALEEEPGFRYFGSRLEDILTGTSISMMHELSCLSKIMGHPFCDMQATAEDLQQKTNEIREVNIAMVSDAVRNAKQDFISIYIRKKNVWPPVTLLDQAPEVIRQAVQKNVDPKSAHHQARYGVLRLAHWDHVVLNKIEEFDRLENFIPYVKDRTVSLLKSQVLQLYFGEEGEEKPKIDWRETRALLAYLLLPHHKTDHLSYLELYADEDWEAMADLLLIRLVPKEKEHKVKARCFGCKPAKERARTIVLGHNASKFLHKYSDSEAMTLSELTLTKKLYSFRNMYKAYKNYEQIIICLDASGWNSRLRNAALEPIAGQVLDGVFGTTMFAQFHRTYSHMFFYLPDVDEVYHWEGQAGGIEGLDQYIWVHSYIAHLKTVLGRFGYPYQLLVKGDDARVVILVPPQILDNRSLDDVRTELVTELTEGCAEFGHLMKVEDSYGSQTYCAFSKNAFIRNIEQPQSFRKCQKSYGANNAFMNTIDDYVASSFSNAHSTSKTAPSPFPCFFLALWWMMVALLRDVRYKSLSDYELIALTLLPNMLGGFPIVYLHNFFQRAESDLLASFCEIMIIVNRVDPSLAEVLRNCWSQKRLDPQENVEVLCMDPYSLPFYKPPSAQSVLRRHLRDTISKLSRNQMIKDLFATRKSDFHDILVEILGTCNIYNPKVMCGIHSCSPEGIIMELLTKFESGKSALDAIILRKDHRKGIRVLRAAKKADDDLHKFRTLMIKGRVKGSEDVWITHVECGAEAAQRLRTTLWGRPIEGVTQAPVYHTVTIGDLEYHLSNRDADRTHFEAQVSMPEHSQTRDGKIFSEGPFEAFLGNSTGKGLSHPEVKIMSENIFALKIAKLLDLYKWCQPTEARPEGYVSIAELCAQMILRYTGRKIKDFLPFAAERPVGRTMHHHLRANQFRPSIIPNTLQNVYTWIRVDMLSHLDLAASNRHFKFNYHEIRCWIVSCLVSRVWAGDRPIPNKTYWAVTTTCQTCSAPLEERSIWCRQRILPHAELMEQFEDARSSIREILEEVDEFAPETYTVDNPDDERITPEQAASAICQYLMDEEWTARRMLEDTTTGHAVTMEGHDTLRAWYGVSSRSIVSFEDLRNVPMRTIFTSIFPLIVSDILSRFPQVTVANVGALLTAVPATMLPWTVILHQLSKIHRVRELQLYASNQLREAAEIYDNYASYSARLGAQCYRLWTRRDIGRTEITVLSNKPDAQIRVAIKKRLKSWRRSVFFKHFNPFNADYATQEARDRATCQLLCGLARYYLFNPDYEINRGVHGEIIDTPVNLFNTDQNLDVGTALLELLDRDNKFASIIKNKFDKLPMQEVYNLIQEDDGEIYEMLDHEDEEVRQGLERYHIVLRRMDIITCKEKVRQFEAREERVRGMNQVLDHLLPDWDWAVQGNYLMIRPFDVRNTRREISLASKQELLDLSERALIYDRIASPLWLSRPAGAFNISMSRYMYIFDQIRMYGFGTHRFCVAFGDGLGGATRVVGSMCRNSRILFVTSPTSSGECPIPAHVETQGRGNQVITTPIRTGRWDLQEVSNFKTYEEDYEFLVDVCICDAEVVGAPDVRRKSYEKIWKNVTVYFFRNSKENSILIIKVYLYYWDLLLRLIAFVRPWSRRLILIQSRGSGWNQEIFLVLSKGEPFNPEYEVILQNYPTEVRTRSYVTFWADYFRRCQEQNRSPDTLELNPRYSKFVNDMTWMLPSYGWNQLMHIVRCSETHSRLRPRRNESRTNCAARCVDFLEALARPFIATLTQAASHDMSRYAGLYANTLTHKLEILYKLAIVQAMIFIFNIIGAEIRVVSKDRIQEWYSRFIVPYQQLHRDLRRPLGEHFANRVLVFDRYNIYHAWTQGVRWGLAAACWSLYVERPEDD